MGTFKINKSAWDELIAGPAITNELTQLTARIKSRAESNASSYSRAKYTSKVERSSKGRRRVYGRVATDSAQAAGIEPYYHFLERAAEGAGE